MSSRPTARNLAGRKGPVPEGQDIDLIECLSLQKIFAKTASSARRSAGISPELVCLREANASLRQMRAGRGCEKIVVAAGIGLGFAIAVICEASDG
jgi:hypothetical protein